ncbi:response regulator transcription factor [Flavitalea sp. BT771]|uniref:response regulator n=1 Tax=Flavitalea sp. BT771 TaxID=3063329 RepID=UPI0026E283CB|nr:response regulator transcription factor [Flavitalea sp. BT771]MDO6432759.1 response regulator transcription factor [Flavitalea sp. BT771]MDV6221965.1 response regulator transcription factor [Flavitalea sp. BT771]
MNNIRVSIVEDIAEIREGMRFIINQTPDLTCLSTYGSAEEAMTGLVQDVPDLCIMDIALPGSTGIDCIRRLKAADSPIQFVVFTIYENSDQVFEALAAGASGYLLKDTPPDRIITALRDLYAGGSPMSASIARKVVSSFQRPAAAATLSTREQEVLTLLARGLLYKEIAQQLDISTGTVRQHIHHIYDKLHVQNRTEAINKFFGGPGSGTH